MLHTVILLLTSYLMLDDNLFDLLVIKCNLNKNVVYVMETNRL